MEYLISHPIIIAIITLIGGFVIALIATFNKKKQRKTFFFILIGLIAALIITTVVLATQNNQKEETESQISARTPAPSLIKPSDGKEEEELADFDEYAMLLEAQKAYDSSDYEVAVKIYKQLMAQNSQSPIPYNNMGYLYSNAILVEEDAYEAKKYYKQASDNGSSVAAGNILCLIARTKTTEEEYLNYLILADKLFDERVESILYYFYTSMDDNVEENDFSEYFFNEYSESQIEMLERLFSKTKFTAISYSRSKIYLCPAGICETTYASTALVPYLKNSGDKYVYINSAKSKPFVLSFLSWEEFEYLP
jgi:hypothetical protein